MSGSEEGEGLNWDEDGVRVATDGEQFALHVRDGDESFMFGDPDTDAVQQEVMDRYGTDRDAVADTVTPQFREVGGPDRASMRGASTAMYENNPEVDVEIGGTPESIPDEDWDLVSDDNTWIPGPSEEHEVGGFHIEVDSKVRQGDEKRRSRTNVARITDGESTTVAAKDAAHLADDDLRTDPSEIDADTVVTGEFYQAPDALSEADTETLAETVDTVYAGEMNDAARETLGDHGVHVVVGEDQELDLGAEQSTDQDVTSHQAGAGSVDPGSERQRTRSQENESELALEDRAQFDANVVRTRLGIDDREELADKFEEIHDAGSVTKTDLNAAARAVDSDAVEGFDGDPGDAAQEALDLREAMDDDGIESATEAFKEVEGAREEFVDGLSEARELQDGEIKADDVGPVAKAAKNEASDRNAAVDRVLLASQASDPENAENLMEGVDTVYDSAITEAGPDSLEAVANANGLDVGTEEMEGLVERRTDLRDEIDDEALERAVDVTTELGPGQPGVDAGSIAENLDNDDIDTSSQPDVMAATQMAVVSGTAEESHGPDVNDVRSAVRNVFDEEETVTVEREKRRGPSGQS